jgi:hypothetical protein
MVHVTRYIAMVDNQSWVNVHAYFVEGFKCTLILLNLERLVGSGIINNLTNMILNFLMVYGA